MHPVRQQLKFCVLVSWTVHFHQESPATDQIAHGFCSFLKLLWDPVGFYAYLPILKQKIWSFTATQQYLHSLFSLQHIQIIPFRTYFHCSFSFLPYLYLMEEWKIPSKFPSPNIFSSFICNKPTRSVLPTLFLLLPSFSLLFQEVKIFIWIPWFLCSRLLEYGLLPVSIMRLTVQKLILPFLPKTLPDRKILWKFRSLLHSFTSFTPSYKERNILVSSRFHPTFCLRHIPLSVSALLIWNYKEIYLQNISFLNFLQYQGLEKIHKNQHIPEEYCLVFIPYTKYVDLKVTERKIT